MIAFIGTGLLGANFTKALLAKGEKVQVWNRTASKATALEADGAKAFDNVADAVRGASRIHLTLTDDAVVDAVLEQAAEGLTPGCYIIDHSTTSTEGALRRTQQWAERGFIYIHAPVFMGPVNALESSGYMLVSGDQEVIAKITPWLSAMTGKLLNLGERTEKAAGLKLIGNLFLIALTSGISDMLALGKAVGVDGSDILGLFSEWNPGAMAPGRLKRVLAAQFDNPSWELQMARKDARLMMEEAAKGDKELVMVSAVAKQMDQWLDKGHAHKDWTIIASGNL
ncbi:NAD(P)-dependent oxidoreductase [Polluticoccus soli]|uniref:NAD(P)-dependent oxidoreductase n=1 Tax=Polluticoccus soli TaxID=3034150 RepID=UPI0023E0E350|nr:NAD(P)-dependent oxidoreductase [Flavipsychrobacter sp. JY13-12]